jgi:hypothetical protein
MAFNPLDFSISSDGDSIEIQHLQCGEVLHRERYCMNLSGALIRIEGHECAEA